MIRLICINRKTINRTTARRLFAAFVFVVLSACSSSGARFEDAVDRGDANEIAGLIGKDVSLHAAGAELQERAFNGDLKGVRLLYDAGAERGIESDAVFPLLAAASRDRIDVINFLLDRGVNINQQQDAFELSDTWTSVGKIPRDRKVTFGKLPQFKETLHGPIQNYHVVRRPGRGNSALSIAIINRNANSVRVLLKRGADPDLPVIYENPQFSFLKSTKGKEEYPELALRVDIHFSAVTADGVPIFFNKIGEYITTNFTVYQEKTATPRELARASEVADLVELFK